MERTPHARTDVERTPHARTDIGNKRARRLVSTDMERMPHARRIVTYNTPYNLTCQR